MTDAKNNPPEILRKQGILRAVDNIGAGLQLQVPSSLLWAYFGAELRARYITHSHHDSEQPADV